MRISDLKQKEVINAQDCKRLGFVGDVDFDMKSGCMTAIIVPGPGAFCGFLGREKEYVIPFCDICQVGDDIILVHVKQREVDIIKILPFSDRWSKMYITVSYFTVVNTDKIVF